jgi:hypothetical protein
MELELKIRELLCVEIHWKILELWIFDEIWPTCSWLHLIAMKNQFPSKEDQKVEFHSKREIQLIS